MNYEQHRDYRFGTPSDLRSGQPFLRRAMLIGSCGTGPMPGFVERIEGACPVDFFNVNHGCLLPETPPEPLDAYDFFIIQIPIRVLFPDVDWMRLDPDDEAAAEALLDRASQVLEHSLDNALLWTRQSGVPAFVANFLVPQQNPHGLFMPRYALTNPVHFIERLNRCLYDLVAVRDNAYLLDFDQVSAMFGRKLAQDDAMTLFSHGGTLADFDVQHDGDRIEVVPAMSEQYGTRTEVVLSALWERAVAMFRTLRGMDAVKAVIVDLDDTLWRGIVAEADAVSHINVEGWPIGFAEALLYLKKRGILLAIASKNDRARIEALWPQLYQGLIRLSDFAAVHIGWDPKAQSVGKILEEFNILPRNAIFIDDNPVEREAVQSAFPDIRVLGANPYHLRRILLWSPELQLPSATAESRRRTEMVQSQVVRDTARKQMTHEDFLASLAPVVTVFQVVPQDGARFTRVFELLNKTNQFNTTGQRWTRPELDAFMAAGGMVLAFEVTDKHTHYGLVGIALAQPSAFVQFVMSCRVLGLGVEVAALATMVTARMTLPVTAQLVHTTANMPVRDLWVRAGFAPEGDGFVLSDGRTLQPPAHVKVVDELDAAPAEASAPAPAFVPEPAKPHLVTLRPAAEGARPGDTLDAPRPRPTTADLLLRAAPPTPPAVPRASWLTRLFGRG